MTYLKGYLQDTFRYYLDEFDKKISEDFLLRQLSAGFAEAVKWWIAEDTKHRPEEIAAFYMATIGK